MAHHQEAVLIRQIPGIKGITLVSGHSICNDFKRHIHKTACIGLIHNGKRQLHIQGQKFTLYSGDLFCINPGDVHQCSSDAPHSYSILLLDPYWLKQYTSVLPIKSPSFFTTPAIHKDAELANAFHKLLYTLQAQESLLKKKALLRSFFQMLKTKHSCSDHHCKSISTLPEIVQNLCTYIDTNCSQNLSIKDLSHWAHLSPFYLNRLFRKSLGVSLHEYILFQKIEKSRKLLQMGIPLATIATELGFSDQSHFTRCFRRIVGTSPGGFMRSNTSE